MSDTGIKRALISVYDKTGIVEFARALHTEFGIEIISTGGTAKLLGENDIPVTLVEEITGFPEMLDGRVKTLHPRIHAAILADRDNPEHMRQLAEQSIEPIDMVVVNLYPFEKTIADPKCSFDDAVEMIDVGGPCLLRAAAKNHKHVMIVQGPKFYPAVLKLLRERREEYSSERAGRMRAGLTFARTAGYDGAIAKWLTVGPPHNDPQVRFVEFRSRGRLRYGENPHQQAELLEDFGSSEGAGRIHANPEDVGFRQLNDSAPEMSFNNHVDANAALGLGRELTVGLRGDGGDPLPCCVLLKHTNPCGAGIARRPIDAYRQAYLGDPGAAMGGILGVNFTVETDFAEAVMDSLSRWGREAGAGTFFVEVWIAPRFSKDAMQAIRERKAWGKRVRLIPVGDLATALDANARDFKRISGGFLAQTSDAVGLNEEQWQVVTQRRPSEEELEDLRLAWLVCKHTKSNAISICREGMLIGNGAGQMSRVTSCRIATWLAAENGHEEKLPGAVAASDAFFPFRDGPDMLMEAGVRAIIQPGGSKRDEETIAACDERGAAMVFTGKRHFKH